MTAAENPTLPAPLPPFYEGRLELPGGRCLGWAEFGAPGGVPVIYCHGVPGSRREAACAAAAAQTLGLRLIAVDRPGYGWSDPATAPGLLAGTEDLDRLADALGLDRFLVLGVSGGAPAAVAAAGALPERVAALGLVCPVGPPALLPPGTVLPWPWRLLLRVGRWPEALGSALHPLSLWFRRRPQDLLRIFGWVLAPVDQVLLRDPGVRITLAGSIREALRQSSRGVARDLFHFASPWECSPAAVTVPVRLWQGGRDRLVPAALSQILGDRLPRARTFLLPQEGHFSLPIAHGEEILRTLLAAAGDLPSWYNKPA
jgi:pimeloyl-ACP methyl ester carboxylesterase